MAESQPDPGWSQLPRELLDLISKFLHTDTDLLRFRSVCSTWRSSTTTTASSPSRFPILPNDGISETSWGFFLSKRSLYLLKSPSPSIKSWIIKIERDNPTRLHLLSPLSSRSGFKPLPVNFPRPFDFSKFRIIELGHEYTLQYINYRPLASSIGDAGNLYMEKVAMLFQDGGFLLLTIHVSGKLVMYKSGDTKWTLINELPLPYDDVIALDGQFYAVDNTGRTVVLNFVVGDNDSTTASVSVVAEPVYGGDKKFLVECCGQLMLVDMDLSVGISDIVQFDEEFEFDSEIDCDMSERTMRFKVYVLDNELKEWVEVQSLGDKILFLGDNCTYSCSALELGGGCKGNCVLFTDQFFHSSINRDEDDPTGAGKSLGIGVYDLESGSIGPICCCDGYSEMFWPPPDWVYPTADIGAGIDQLNI